LKSALVTERGVAPASKVLFRLEGTVAVAQQNADVVAVSVSDGEIEFAVAVEVGDGHEMGLGSHAKVCFGFEGAVAVAQQNADVVGADVSGDEIKFAVAIEIGDGHERLSPD
jgi:hypothetical protein